MSGPGLGITPASPDFFGNHAQPTRSSREVPEESHPCMEQHQSKKMLGLFELGKGKQRKNKLQTKVCSYSCSFPLD